MSWHFLQEQEAASWEENSLVGAPSALLKLMPSAEVCCSHGSAMESLLASPSGTTCGRSMGNRGRGVLMSSVLASHAKTSAPQALALELTGSAPVSGEKWRVLPVRYDRISCGWKTALSLWDEGLPECSVTLPAWGCMHDGECWERTMLERPTFANGCGFLPTPTKTDANGRTYHYSRGDKTKAVPSLLGVVKLLPTPAATDWKGQYTWETVKKRMAMTRGVRLPEELSRRVGKAIIPNPEFWEWMMGWPIGSTALQPLATGKFQQWLQWHSLFFRRKPMPSDTSRPVAVALSVAQGGAA